MTEFLLQNKANIDARTFGDEQAAIHYAAKNGAAQSLKVLLGYHADIDTLDANKKTPLQVSLYVSLLTSISGSLNIPNRFLFHRTWGLVI
jgi:ankyrin repeat protein